MNSAYGAWISPNGEVIDVSEYGHSKYISYQDANEEGWICIIYGSDSSDYFYIRLNPETAKEPALKTLLRLINKLDKNQFVFEDIWQNLFNGFTLNDSCKDIIQARNLIRNIAQGKVKGK